jgi:outer membrane protein, heavy metal efflux system
MKRILIIINLIFFAAFAFSQNSVEKVLSEIEKNNTGLKAFSQQQDAGRILNRVGIFPHNPEFEFAYLYGNPIDIGNRTNISLMQSFDFPSAYLHKGRIANAKNEQLLPEFEKHLRDLLLEAEWVCLDLIYYNAMAAQYSERLDHARKIVDAYEKMFAAGECSKIELNKAKLYFLNIQKEYELIQIKQQELKNSLTGFNGGIEISIDDEIFEEIIIDLDFDQFYLTAEKRNPLLQWLTKEIEIGKHQERLQKSLNLPSFSAGYVSEALTHEQFKGIAVGISIPLWENKNKLNYARANTLAYQLTLEDEKMKFQNMLKTMHSSAIMMNKSLEEYKDVLGSADNTVMLKIAWEKGEISLTNYLFELSDYYHSADKMLEMELELQKTYSVINQYIK